MTVSILGVLPRICISNLSLNLKLFAYWYHPLDVVVQIDFRNVT
jgi:hypothetical protein